MNGKIIDSAYADTLSTMGLSLSDMGDQQKKIIKVFFVSGFHALLKIINSNEFTDLSEVEGAAIIMRIQKELFEFYAGELIKNNLNKN